jgi:hypothetical protein
MNAMDLDLLLTAELQRAALRLGHKNALADKEDALLIRDDVAELLREKWHYLTENEIRLVFRLGSTGELKLKPDEVVFLSVATVAEWLRRYKYTTKPAAMWHASSQVPPHTDLPEHHPVSIGWRVNQICLLVDAYDGLTVDDVGELDPGNCLYDWLKEIRAFHGFRTMAEYEEMRVEETERLFSSPQSPHKEERMRLRSFADALEKGNWPAEHPMARNVANACKKRVFKEWLMDQCLNDVDTRDHLTTLAINYYDSLPAAA